MDSELGNLRLSHVHDGLHMRLEEVRDDSLVELASFCSLKLHLIDVAILVSNRAWRPFVALGEALQEAQHVRYSSTSLSTPAYASSMTS